jgi:hypothetical protein
VLRMKSVVINHSQLSLSAVFAECKLHDLGLNTQ